MRIALQTEECGGFARCLPVRCLDRDTRLKARKCFADYRARGIIRNGAFEDDVWTLTDELRNCAIDFRFDAERFRMKAEMWIGCAEECHRDCMKAYIAFQLGSYTLSYLQTMANGMKLVAGMTKEEAETVDREERTHLIGFLFLIPGGNDLKDKVIEALEEQDWTVRSGGPRALADFPRYLWFNKSLDDFWTRATEKEKLFYFPVYFWWKLTAVLPLRVTEFLLTPRDCLRRAEGKFLLSVRRTRLKKRRTQALLHGGSRLFSSKILSRRINLEFYKGSDKIRLWTRNGKPTREERVRKDNTKSARASYECFRTAKADRKLPNCWA